MIAFIKRLLGIKRSIPFEIVLWWIKRRCADQVISGPFKGAKCVDGHVGCQICPRLLGIYEIELQPTVRRLLDMPFDEVLDIGAAEGYYVVGFALNSRANTIIAYETEPSGQALLKRVAALNGVGSKVVIKGKCDLSTLSADLAAKNGPRLVIVDIEGAEKALLDPDQVPELRNSFVLVELHDQFDPDISTTLRERFQSTHRVEQIHTRPRSMDDLPVQIPWWLRGPLRKWLLMAIDDSRGVPMSWYFLQPCAIPNAATQLQHA